MILYMNYYSKYLKYKENISILDNYTIYNIIKYIPKSIVAATQVIGEKTYNEIKCIYHKEDSIKIIKLLNEHRNSIISLFTLNGYILVILYKYNKRFTPKTK